MKIGVMLRHLNEIGGINVYTKNVIENLLEIDRKNDYIFLYNSDSFIGTYSKYENVKELVIDKKNKFLWDQFYIPRIVKSEKIDIIFNPKLSIPLFASAKKVLTMHGLEQFACPGAFKLYDNIYVHLMMPLFCHFANSIIVMTNFGKNDLIKYLKVRSEKIEVIHESYHKRFEVKKNPEKLLEIKQKYDLPDKFIFFVGGLAPLKNFTNIIKAFNIVRKKTSTKLVLAGFKRFKYAKDLELIDRLKLQDDIRYLGFVSDDDIPYLYNLAECFIFPSLYEGFGIPVLEAQACGCPVVSTKTGATPEVSGGAAILVNPYNQREIAQAVYNVLTEEDLKEKLVKAGIENVKKYSWLETARKTLQLFEKVFQS
jgi:glycosyltransferase involved in cell wall biosynthesis